MKKHVAGIIPVAGLKSDFDLPWHPSLMPLAPNYLAVERSVAECAYAGCNTIWMVCNDDVTPLIRYQVGEKIQDPVYDYRHFEHNKNDVKRPIRIYYTPVSPRDINKRDSLTWSVLHGAKTAHKIMKSISTHLTPDKYYISWPYGYYNPRIMRGSRRDILESNVALAQEGQTVKDNHYLGLTLTIDHIEELHSKVKSLSTGLWRDSTRKEKLPVEERYSYRNFDLKTALQELSLENYKMVNVEDYCAIDTWSGYCDLLGKLPDIKRPAILKYSEWNEIGFDE